MSNNIAQNENIIIDLTTAITLISDCCTQTDFLKQYGNNLKLLGSNIYEQTTDEIKDPVFPKLMKALENKNIHMINSAYDKFIQMIETLGSDSEKKYLLTLKPRIKIIKPQPTQFFINLNSNRRWNKENIDTCGTADSLGYTLFTGNLFIVRFLDNKMEQLNFKIQPHRSRSFVGKKINKLTKLTKLNIDSN